MVVQCVMDCSLVSEPFRKLWEKFQYFETRTNVNSGAACADDESRELMEIVGQSWSSYLTNESCCMPEESGIWPYCCRSQLHKQFRLLDQI